MVVSLLFVSLIFGIAWVIEEEKDSIKNLELTITDIRFIGFVFPPGGLLPSGLTVELDLDGHNPNEVDIKLYGLTYQVYITDVFVGNGSLARKEQIEIPRNETRSITIQYTANLTILPTLAIVSIQNIIQNEDIHWKITGTAYVDTPLGKDKFPFTWEYPPDGGQG
jgi:hypothetical protein